MEIFYAGDSQVGGPANYLLGVLKSMKARVKHVPPGRPLRVPDVKDKFKVFILSDFSRKDCPGKIQRKILEQVQEGSGLLMIGGWSSFSGIFGGWKGSVVEKNLPVSCSYEDDRLNIPGGALIVPKQNHEITRGLDFGNTPVIAGMNSVRVRQGSRVILSARRILSKKMGQNFKISLEERELPLLVVSREKRIAALTTDIAPHWCGGMVDWGKERVRLPVTPNIEVEVGNMYVKFLEALLKWLAGEESGK